MNTYQAIYGPHRFAAATVRAGDRYEARERLGAHMIANRPDSGHLEAWIRGGRRVRELVKMNDHNAPLTKTGRICRKVVINQTQSTIPSTDDDIAGMTGYILYRDFGNAIVQIGWALVSGVRQPVTTIMSPHEYSHADGKYRRDRGKKKAAGSTDGQCPGVGAKER